MLCKAERIEVLKSIDLGWFYVSEILCNQYLKGRITIKSKICIIVGGVLSLLIGLPGYSQTERWVYRYNGPVDSTDVANSLVYGTDGNIYAIGYSKGIGTGNDFMVISLNKDTGDTNWVYRYNGPGNGADAANSIVYGADGSIYAAGYSDSSSRDMVVISLTSSGAERWIYRYNGPVDSTDVANSIAYGSDSNIYIAGVSQVNGTYQDITIISLTSAGSERWVYRYNGSGNGSDAAFSIIYGDDSNIYCAGYSWSSGTETDFTVLSVTSAGSERWVYHDRQGEAYSVVYGNDGNIYAAGVLGYNYFAVISLTSGGGERWVYVIPPPHSACESSAYSVDYGHDGNVYAAGVSDTTSEYPLINPDFTVASITPTGSERWVYRYDGGYADQANAIVCGNDSNIYTAGVVYYGNGTRAFTVISLTPAGWEHWIYGYNGPGWDDIANSIVYGLDGNIYAAGFSERGSTYSSRDFIVISLNPEPGVEEQLSQEKNKNFDLSIGTIQNKNLKFSLTLHESCIVAFSLYSIVGQKILSWHVPFSNGIRTYAKDLSALSAGVYVIKAETSKRKYAESRKIIYVK